MNLFLTQYSEHYKIERGISTQKWIFRKNVNILKSPLAFIAWNGYNKINVSHRNGTCGKNPQKGK